MSLHLPRLKRMNIVQRIGRAFNRRLRGDNDDGSDNQGLFTTASQVELGSGPSEPGRVSREQGTINGPMERHGEVPARDGDFRRETVVVDVNGDTFNRPSGVARNWYAPREMRRFALAVDPFDNLVEVSKHVDFCIESVRRDHVALGSPPLDL